MRRCKEGATRTFEVKRKATEIQEDVAAHKERTRRITNGKATSVTELALLLCLCLLFSFASAAVLSGSLSENACVFQMKECS